jgi:hypothetical protein
MGGPGQPASATRCQGFVERAREVDGGEAKQHGNMVVATTLTKTKREEEKRKDEKSFKIDKDQLAGRLNTISLLSPSTIPVVFGPPSSSPCFLLLSCFSQPAGRVGDRG